MRKAFEELANLKSILNDLKSTSNNQLDDGKVLEIVLLINNLKQRQLYLNNRRSLRVMRQRLLRREKKKNNANENLIDFKINEFFQTEQLFGSYKKFDQNIEDKV